MKKKTRDIIAISVASIAALLIIFVIIINLIVIDPMKQMRQSSSYEICYGTKQLTSSTDQGKKIESRNADSINRQYESTSMTELMDECKFSLYRTWIQFKYDYAPGFGYDEYWNENHNYISAATMKGIYEGTDSVAANSFRFIFSFNEQQSITIRDNYGYEYTQYYDRAVIVLEDSKDWVENIKMYVFEYSALYSTGHAATTPNHELGTSYFYPIVLGAVTTKSIVILEDIFDGHYAAADSGEHTDDDGHDHG